MPLKDKTANAVYHKGYWKEYYSDPERKRRHILAVRKNEKKRLVAMRERVSAYKMQKGCVDCGFNSHSCALDFDHIDPSVKLFNIGNQISRGWSWARLLKEIEKCVIRCANCHRIKHHAKKINGPVD